MLLSDLEKASWQPRVGGQLRLPVIPVKEKAALCSVVMCCVLLPLVVYFVYVQAASAKHVYIPDYESFENKEKWYVKPSASVAMFRYDVQHTGRAPRDASAQHPYVLRWVTPRLNHGEYGASKSTPAVDADLVYIGTDESTLLAFDRSSGKLRWTFQCYRHTKGIHGSPAFDAEHVYVGAYTGHMYAINKLTGKVAWENKVCGSIGSSPVVWDGAVFIGAEYWDAKAKHGRGRMIGLRASDGKEVFSSQLLPHFAHSTPTVDPDTGVVYMGDNSAHTYAWDVNEAYKHKLHRHIRDQPVAWEFAMNAGGDMKGTPTVYGDVVYVACWDNHVYALNKATGALMWNFNLGSKSMSSPSVDPDSEILVIGCHSGMVYGLDMYTGVQRWSVRTGARVMSSATLLPHEKMAVIGSFDRFVYVIQYESGVVLQKIGLKSGLTGQPTVCGEWLYVFDHLGYLYAFQGRPGTQALV